MEDRRTTTCIDAGGDSHAHDCDAITPACSSSTVVSASRSSPLALLEVCVDSVQSAIAAERGGAKRIELCSSLVEGGVTPSYGMIKAVRAAVTIHVMVLIRPRPGDFAYSAGEMSIIESDIACCKSLGVDGVVLGMLLPSGEVDVELTRRCLSLAAPMSVTFHRAIDMTTDLMAAARTLVDIGVTRVLTSGGAADAIKGQEMVKSLVSSFGSSLTILAGGGLSASTIPSFVSATGVREVHASLRGEWRDGRMVFRKSGVHMGAEKRNDGMHVEYATRESEEELVRSVTRSLG